jgi:hypothetical protein
MKVMNDVSGPTAMSSFLGPLERIFEWGEGRNTCSESPAAIWWKEKRGSSRESNCVTVCRVFVALLDGT